MLSERYTFTRSKELIPALRNDGVKLLRNGISCGVSDIPADIQERTSNLCDGFPHIRTIEYDIIDPATNETAILKIWDCGYAEVIE